MALPLSAFSLFVSRVIRRRRRRRRGARTFKWLAANNQPKWEALFCSASLSPPLVLTLLRLLLLLFALAGVCGAVAVVAMYQRYVLSLGAWWLRLRCLGIR